MEVYIVLANRCSPPELSHVNMQDRHLILHFYMAIFALEYSCRLLSNSYLTKIVHLSTECSNHGLFAVPLCFFRDDIMPVGRRGLVVPQNTFLENVVRRSNGLRKYSFVVENCKQNLLLTLFHDFYFPSFQLKLTKK